MPFLVSIPGVYPPTIPLYGGSDGEGRVFVPDERKRKI